MDGFIDYDDEEDEGPMPRNKYDYASDGSSDMEAALSDIDDEERLAESIAKAEDRREAAEEARHKMAKEQRKKLAMQELKARRR